MKNFFALLWLLAIVGFGDAADFCAPQAKSCVNLPQSSAEACSSIISRSKLRLTTCSKPKSTVTKTSMIQPSATQTVIVTQTVSSRVVKNVQKTVLNTVTSTTVSHTTLVEPSTSTAQTTIIVPETSTITRVITETTTSTTTMPYQQETCAAAAPAVRKRQTNYKALDIVPRDCSCYLTTTTACTQPTTTWTTITKPTSTTSVTQYKLTTLVEFDTKTVNTLQTATVTTSEFSTDTLTATIGVTVTQLTTSIVSTTTATTTITTTAVATAQANPCADPVLFTTTRPDYPGSEWGIASDSNSPKDCCKRCFSGNAECLFWKWSDKVCWQYVIPNNNPAVSCITNTCRRGRPALVSVAGDGATYGVGICAASGFNG